MFPDSKSMGKYSIQKNGENKVATPGGAHSIVIRGAGSIVWGLGFWFEKDILGFFKNIDLGNSQGVAKMIHMDN